ncbi:small terminase [Sphingomonas phage Scott]|uniref:Small terminase n=1 Tax=Sphingomonas phage Scott TaxID=2282912 RepID=A0A346FDB9_9CAUD|nr:terminase small subunit [Sphingomonas phage Scott]AXN53733.1 small terminase [Sphingomonas phage Scott]
MAASETALGALHVKVTEVLTEALDGDTIPGYTEVNEATGEVTEVPDRKLPPSAAIIAAATKFLKDNNITCAPSEDNAVGDLVNKLREKQKLKASRLEMRDAKADMGFLSGLPN